MGARRKIRELANLTLWEVELLRDAPYERPRHISKRRSTERIRADRLIELGLLERDVGETGCLHRATDEGAAEAAPLKAWEVEHALHVIVMDACLIDPREHRLVQRVLIDAALAMAEDARPGRGLHEARVGAMVLAGFLGKRG
jgi:hypothetical protein